jgi:hypothetical protein
VMLEKPKLLMRSEMAEELRPESNFQI